MSRRQWGHGFHTGKAAARSDSALGFPAGLFFHTRNEYGRISRQGVVVGKYDDGEFLVRFFSWFDGFLLPDVFKFTIDEAADWSWYDSAADMRMAYEFESGITEDASFTIFEVAA